MPLKLAHAKVVNILYTCMSTSQYLKVQYMQSSTIIVIWNGPWVRSSGGVRLATDLHVRKHMHVRICLSVVMRPNMFVYSHLWQPFWTFDVVHFVMEMVDPKAIFLLTVDRSKLCIYNVHVPTCADRKHYVYYVYVDKSFNKWYLPNRTCN